MRFTWEVAKVNTMYPITIQRRELIISNDHSCGVILFIAADFLATFIPLVRGINLLKWDKKSFFVSVSDIKRRHICIKNNILPTFFSFSAIDPKISPIPNIPITVSTSEIIIVPLAIILVHIKIDAATAIIIDTRSSTSIEDINFPNNINF